MNQDNALIQAILSEMPGNTESYLTERGGEVVLSCHWKLNNDPDRPNKYSKTITIFLSREFAEDFSDFPDAHKGKILENLKGHIHNKLENFDPDHDIPRYQPEPIEKWVIESAHIFSNAG